MHLVVRSGLVLVLTLATVGTGFSQVQTVQAVQTVQPNRIPQQIIINGQQVNAAYVPSPSGGLQSYTCPGPQEYVTADGASRGWACYDYAAGVWLLNALPPAPQPVQQPAVVYQPPPPATVVYTQLPAVVYTEPVRTVIVQRPVYPASVVIGAAVINAAGRIASAAILSSHHRGYYSYPVRGRRWY